MLEDIKKKDKRITIRLSQNLYDMFSDFIHEKSEEVGTKITQAQAFEILVRDMCEKR